MIESEKAFPSTVEVLLKEQEGQRLDFKSKRIQPAKLSKTLAAMANADGGEIYVGIEDERRWDGFSSQEEANALLDMVSRMFPLGDSIAATFVESDGFTGQVLKLDVSRTADIKKAVRRQVI